MDCFKWGWCYLDESGVIPGGNGKYYTYAGGLPDTEKTYSYLLAIGLRFDEDAPDQIKVSINGKVFIATYNFYMSGMYVYYGVIELGILDEDGNFSGGDFSPAHTHGNWTYSAPANVLTATCGNSDCDLTDSKVSLTLTATSPNYSGSETYAASLGDTSAWTGAGLTVPTIKYYKATSEGGTEGTEEVTDLNGLAAGNYYAAVTVETATAKAAFKVIPPHTHNGITFDKPLTLTDIKSQGIEAGNYYLTEDLELTSFIYINNKIVNLCLNGHVLKAASGTNVIRIQNGGELNLYDCGTTEHYFTVGDNGLWTLTGGKTDATETVVGGVITRGEEKNWSGGGAISVTGQYLGKRSTLNMYGGNIVGNSSIMFGGGVHVNGVFHMKGGTIQGNVAPNGAGVNVEDDSVFNLTNGEIKNNCVSTGDGGGVKYNGYDDNSFIVGGSAKICDNKRGSGETATDNNVYLFSDYITLGTGTGEGGNGVAVPNEDMDIGITPNEEAGRFTSNGTEDDVKYFTPDNDAYEVEYNASGYLQLVIPQAEDYYPVRIGGTKISRFNKDDVLRDGGSVSFDPDTNTLTLNNTAIATDAESSVREAIKSELPAGKTLTVKLIGTNVIGRAPDEEYEEYTVDTGLFIGKGMTKAAAADGSLLLIGDKDSSLTIYASGDGISSGDTSFGEDGKDGKKFEGELKIYSDHNAIESRKSVFANGGKIFMESQNQGIHTKGDVTVSDGELTIRAENRGISASGAVTISGGKLDVTGGEDNCAIFADGGFSITSTDFQIIARGSDPDYGAIYSGSAPSFAAGLTMLGSTAVDAEIENITATAQMVASEEEYPYGAYIGTEPAKAVTFKLVELELSYHAKTLLKKAIEWTGETQEEAINAVSYYLAYPSRYDYLLDEDYYEHLSSDTISDEDIQNVNALFYVAFLNTDFCLNGFAAVQNAGFDQLRGTINELPPVAYELFDLFDAVAAKDYANVVALASQVGGDGFEFYKKVLKEDPVDEPEEVTVADFLTAFKTYVTDTSVSGDLLNNTKKASEQYAAYIAELCGVTDSESLSKFRQYADDWAEDEGNRYMLNYYGNLLSEEEFSALPENEKQDYIHRTLVGTCLSFFDTFMENHFAKHGEHFSWGTSEQMSFVDIMRDRLDVAVAHKESMINLIDALQGPDADEKYPLVYEYIGEIVNALSKDSYGEEKVLYTDWDNLYLAMQGENVVTSAFEVVDTDNGREIKLLKDINCAELGIHGEALSVGPGKSITLDLNGHKLDRNLKAATEKGSVITVPENATLTLKDTSEAKTGKVTGGKGFLSGSEYLGGGVYVSGNGTFEMNGGTIAGCEATKGGGVFTWGKFTMNGNSEIVDCKAEVDGGGVCACNCAVTMNDNSKVRDCTAGNGAGGVYTFGNDNNNPASFTMNGNSTISDCKASSNHSETGKKRNGGGVSVEGSTFTMNGGTISGNDATANEAGGVSVYNGTFKMNGGTIVGNKAKGSGGGVEVKTGAKFNMTGGTISGNTAGFNGGGVYVSSTGTFTMTGGEIIGNNAKTGTYSKFGGGVFFDGDTISLGGTARITDNTAGAEGSDATNNVFLPNGKYITLGTDTKPTGSFKVGVTTQTAPTEAAPVKITTNGTADDTKYFISDNADYMVNFNTNYLELAKIVAYNYTQIIKYASLAEAVSKAVSGDEIELWADENAESVVLPDGVTLYAKSGYTGTVTTNTEGKSVAKQDMFGDYQYKFFVADILMITYKDQGGTTFSGTHESGYPTTFMAEIPLVLKSATKANYPFGGWFDNAECTGNPITGFYAYAYTDNLTLYAKWICNHTSSFTKVKGQAPTESASGWKDYYKCDCGALFEDENGTTPIGNFDTWIAEGGNGYIAKLEEAPLTPEPKKEEYTIPVESEDAVQVEATIENGTAEVEEITKETLEEIVQPVEGKKTTTDAIVIDLSQAKQEVTGIVLTAKSVENLKDVLASDKNEIKTVVIKLSEATVEIDAKTLETIGKESDGNSIRLVVDKTEEKQLNTQQKETLVNYNVDKTFEAYFESNGQRISSFNGGEVVVGIKFTPGEGKNANHFKIYYIDENGKMQKFATKYEDGLLKFSTTHFSDYAIVYDEKVEVLLMQGKATGKNAIKLSWNELDNTTKYVVYGNSCGKTSKKLKTVKSNKFTVKKIAGKKLVAHKTYKFYVVGYDAVGNKTTSKTIHFIAANTQGKYANVKSIKAKASTLQLAVGEFSQVGATYKMYSGKKHIGSEHGKALRYISDCPEVASVSSTGKVLARRAGTATIYIQDIGGKYCKTIVTVK